MNGSFDPRVKKGATEEERELVMVRVLRGNPVADGLGNVYRSGMRFRLPRVLALALVQLERVELVTSEQADQPIDTRTRVHVD